MELFLVGWLKHDLTEVNWSQHWRGHSLTCLMTLVKASCSFWWRWANFLKSRLCSWMGIMILYTSFTASNSPACKKFRNQGTGVPLHVKEIYWCECFTGQCARIVRILHECPIEVFQKNGFQFDACNKVRDIFYNSDVITSSVKVIVHSLAGNLVWRVLFLFVWCVWGCGGVCACMRVCVCVSNITLL